MSQATDDGEGKTEQEQKDISALAFFIACPNPKFTNRSYIFYGIYIYIYIYIVHNKLMYN